MTSLLKRIGIIFKNFNGIHFSIFLITAICFWTSSNMNWGKNHPQHIILADGRGYYAHLPAVFIYHDLNFGFFADLDAGKYYNKHFYYDYRAQYKGRTFTKYYCGTAIAMMPFFLTVHGLVLLKGGDADGYSNWYPIAINIAAIFYLFLALFIISKLMLRKGFSINVVALTLWISVFGTNWYYYTTSEPSVSHVYSAFFIPAFYWLMVLFSEKRQWRHLILAMLCLGLVVLIRPINIICVLFLPFYFNDFKSLMSPVIFVLKKPFWFIGSILIFFAIISLQLILYKIQIGQFFIYAYGEEVFNFMNPHIFDFLFSYKKGLFVYTPVLFISVLGFIYWYHSHRQSFFVLAIFLFLLIYLQSSWYMWWYGGSFGARVQIEFYSLWAFLIAGSIAYFKRKGRIALLSLYAILGLFCLFQTYQYRYNLLHWDSITKESYWEVFLKLP